MAPTTRKPKNRSSKAPAKKVASAPKKTKKHSISTIDPIQLAAQRLSKTHIFATCTKNSAAHDKKCKKYLNEFIAGLSAQADEIGEDLLQLVPSPHGGEVPKLLIEMGGATSLHKSKVVSHTMFHWIYNKCVERGSAEFHQPNTVMQYIRTFLGYMKNLYDWRYSLDKDFNFDGGLNPSLKTLFNQRRKKAGESYGTKQMAAVLKGTESTRALDIFGKKRGKHFFNENDTLDNVMLMVLVHGIYLGFRGSKEHGMLRVNNYERGTFPPGHAWEGEEYWAIVNMEDKTNKLSASNPVIQSHNHMRLPVKSDPGQVIERYLAKLSPMQERVYCKPATEAQKIHFANLGHPNAAFSPNQPLGQNTIDKIMKAALARLGHSGATGHALRRLFITTLANDPGVSIEECMNSARHNSVAANRQYIVRGNDSEAAKFAALGIEKQG